MAGNYSINHTPIRQTFTNGIMSNPRIIRTVYPPDRPPFYSTAHERRWRKLLRVSSRASLEVDWGYLIEAAKRRIAG